MIHPDTKLCWINNLVGHGVIATRSIPKGTILWVQCQLDIVLTPEQRTSLSKAYQDILDIYAYRDQSGDTILNWDLGRYINHSCNPSMISLGPHIEICIQDISPGDELTCDYSALGLDKSLHCDCGQENCRGEINAEDMLFKKDEWYILLQEALTLSPSVSQPLVPFLQNPAEWENFLSGQSSIPLSSSYYYK